MSLWWIEAGRGYLSGWKHGLEKQKGVRILCYHGIVEQKHDSRLERNFHLFAQFKEHLRALRYLRVRVMSLEELIHELFQPPKRSFSGVVITFDDGYKTTLRAAEWLEKWHLPWTLFISTGAVGRENTLWTVELSLLLLHGHARQIDALARSWPLTCREEREEAFQRIRYSLKGMPAERKRRVLEDIRQQFPEGETQRLLEQFPAFQMLTWEEIRGLANAGVEVGSHGVHHEIHHAQQSEKVRNHELFHSKQTIEQQLQKPCRFFAFPNGNFIDSSPSEVHRTGYEAAFTLEPRAVRPGDNPYLLPRLTARGPLRAFIRELFWTP